MSQAGESKEIVNEFLVESYEGLDQLDRDLIELEHRGTDGELLSRVFRCMHTIKGTCGFLGFMQLESVAHVGENLLSRLRDGTVRVSPELTSALLAMIDAVRGMLNAIEEHGHELPSDQRALIATLAALANAPVASEGAATSSTNPDNSQNVEEPTPSATDVGANLSLGEILIADGVANAGDVAAALHEQRQGATARVGEILVARGVTSAAAVHDALEIQQEARCSQVSEGSIRVDVALLDRLMNLVGELVLARNQILQCTATNPDNALSATTQRLNLITSELQEGVMKTRMQPIGNVWSKFPRVVRDLALTCGKQVAIVLEGAETELDKTIIEAIKDPLTHIVRNSVDHGIESPRDRVLADKSPEGRLILRAFHEGGQVNIEITDDGAGIDPEKIRSKAIEKGMYTAEAASKLSDRETLNLIFSAGFSTAAKITNVSGRGVGMDVVKTNIEKIGGTVDVASEVGVGTTLRIRIPLTLAIIPGLIVTSAGERFAIPQVSLLELVRMEHEEAIQRIEMIHNAPVYRLRGKLLPLVHLNHALALANTPWPHETETGDAISIVVVQADGLSFGLVVDRINDTEEIVVKPLGKQLKSITSLAGATIMGDGRVALILDVHGLAERAGLIGVERERAVEQRTQVRSTGETAQTLLLFGFGDTHRMAVPLSEIARLEEFTAESVERTGRHDVVQYRGCIMPLVYVAECVDETPSTVRPDEKLQVIVYAKDGHYVGLVVDRILDVVETTVTAQRRRRSGPVLGSAVIQNKVTDILDIRRLVERVEADFPTSMSEAQREELAHV